MPIECRASAEGVPSVCQASAEQVLKPDRDELSLENCWSALDSHVLSIVTIQYEPLNFFSIGYHFQFFPSQHKSMLKLGSK